MKKLNIFAPESAGRHLIQLGLTLLLCIWSYIIFALISKDWTPFTFYKSQLLVNLIGLSFMFIFAAIAGIATYWCAKKWMLACLKRSGLYFVGAIPFVNLLVPADVMSSWWEEIDTLNSSDGTVTTYYDAFGKLYSTNGSIPLILAIPLGIIKALFKGLGMSLVNLFFAIGIPVLSPILVILGMILTGLLAEWNSAIALIIALILVVAVLAVFVAHPIVVFKTTPTSKKESPNPKK